MTGHYGGGVVVLPAWPWKMSGQSVRRSETMAQMHTGTIIHPVADPAITQYTKFMAVRTHLSPMRAPSELPDPYASGKDRIIKAM